jgi:general secretion pathway protein G
MTFSPAAPVAAPNTSGLAIASLICAILGCTAIVGLILGFVALSKIKASRGQLTGRGLAIAAIVISVIMMLLAVVGIVLSMAVPLVTRAAIHAGATKSAAVGTTLENFEMAIDAFEVDCGRYPTTAEGLKALVQQPAGLTGWKGPYLKAGLPMDSWGHPYFYVCPGRHNPQAYDLYSAGPDGKTDTADDIGNWEKP